MIKTGKIMRDRLKNDKGFTLIEVIAVLIILAIVAAVVISRGTATDAANLQAEVNTLKGHLRYAQCLAMNDIYPTKWGIQIGGSSYTLIRNSTGNGTTFDNPFSLPNESSATHSFAPITATPAVVLFDEWGSPVTTTLFSIGGQSITITPTTGFIQ
jgi:MSHA pilin protein MshC